MHDAAFVTRCAVSRTALTAVFVAALCWTQTAGALRPKAPDTILVNGKFIVYNVAPAQALAVRDGKIAAIGSTSRMRALAGASTRIIDLGGRTVIPGLIDSHI